MPDRATIAEMRTLVDELSERTEALQTQGDQADLPAVQRNAERLAGVIEQLERNLPPEIDSE